MTEKTAGLIGGASFVGERLRPLLENEGYRLISFSRKRGEGVSCLEDQSEWPAGTIAKWICLAPIWTMPDHLHLLEHYGGSHLVALSSTSRFSKIASPSPGDRELASRLVQGEEKVEAWARSRGCTLVILQPTLIYGLGRDRNVTAIAEFIQRFGFFPLLGRGEGLRQPVHVDDVAAACAAALQVPPATRKRYILSGQEVLTYRVMVERIFAALGRRVRFVRCPLFLFSLAIRLARLLPSFRGLTTEMAVRMNNDQSFSHNEAECELNFSPRPFHPDRLDVTAG